MDKLPKKTRFLLEVLLNKQLGELKQRQFITKVRTNSNEFVTCLYKTQKCDRYASFFLSELHQSREMYVETNFSFHGEEDGNGIVLYNEYVDKFAGTLKDIPQYVTISNETGVLLYKGSVASLSGDWKNFIYSLRSSLVAERAIRDTVDNDYTL